MRALKISQFNKLMANESGITIRNHQMSFALLNLNSGGELRSPGSSCVHCESTVYCGAIRQQQWRSTGRDDAVGKERSAAAKSPLRKPARGHRRIEHRVLRHE